MDPLEPQQPAIDSALKCSTCGGIVFDSLEEQRAHFQSPWHIYNTKRKAVGLPPVTEAKWLARVEQLRALQEAEANGTLEGAKGTAHLKDKTTRTRVPTSTTIRPRHTSSSEVGDCPSTIAPTVKEVVLTENSSLFDNHESSSIHENLAYMATKFSFFVPDLQYLVNPVGLARFLARKVGKKHQCIFCNMKFSSLQAVRNHMVSKGHTMLGTDDPFMAAELDRFYDFTTSAEELHGTTSPPDHDDNEPASAAHDDKKSASEDDEESASDEGEWVELEGSEIEEEDEESETDGTAEFEELLRKRGLRMAKLLPDGSLQLPTGGVATHRDYAYLYKQRITQRPADFTSRGPKSLQGKSGQLALLGNTCTSLGLRGVPHSQSQLKTYAKQVQKDLKRAQEQAILAQVKGNRLRNLGAKPQNVELYSYAK